MSQKYNSFEDYLKEIHAQDYTGTDDDMPEAFESWLGGLDIEEFMSYADQYAEIKYREGQEQMYESMAEQNKTFMEVNKKILDSFK